MLPALHRYHLLADDLLNTLPNEVERYIRRDFIMLSNTDISNIGIVLS